MKLKQFWAKYWPYARIRALENKLQKLQEVIDELADIILENDNRYVREDNLEERMSELIEGNAYDWINPSVEECVEGWADDNLDDKVTDIVEDAYIITRKPE